MWLLPIFHRVASLSLRLYFRVSRTGHSVPEGGPVLLVANHPNSLLDPAAVAFAAQRPVRFLAKSTLFSDRIVGWLVKGAGSIPVYRRDDDPAQMGRNVQMFDAVQQALATGAAVGLFPEGVSHNEPSLVALRTGAARIALGTAAVLGRDFPVIPVGLVFRSKSVFRSRAQVIVGEQVRWRDLALCGELDASAVRELTSRIDGALRRITVNLENWADAPIVELADAVYAAEFGLRPDAVERVARVRAITETLGTLRESGSDEWRGLADDLSKHARMLRWFGLSPGSLRVRPKTGDAIGWSLRRIPLAVLGASGIWLAGSILFWVPYRATGIVGERAKKRGADLVSTTRVIGGAIIFGVWIVSLSAAAALLWGPRLGLVALTALPFLAVIALLAHESLRNALRDARRFFRVARKSSALEELRARQHALALRLDELRQRLQI